MGDEAAVAAFARDLEEPRPDVHQAGPAAVDRFDLLPPAYTTALARLQDDAEPFGFDVVTEIVEAELGGQIRHLFAEFEEEPLAAASLGQVHRATLLSGREVVVKVQRPEAREIAREDMETLARLAGLADRHTQAGRRYGFEQLLAVPAFAGRAGLPPRGPQPAQVRRPDQALRPARGAARRWSTPPPGSSRWTGSRGARSPTSARSDCSTSTPGRWSTSCSAATST